MRAAAPISDEEMPGLFAELEHGPLALAVSGGADSMALMHMMARWMRRDDVRKAWALRWQRTLSTPMNCQSRAPIDWVGLAKPPWLVGIETGEELKRIGGTPHVVVLTVDHGLREASGDEARFVAEEAQKLGLACVVLRWEAAKPATGIQEAARTARRELMCDVLRAEAGLLDDIARSAKFGRVINVTRSLITAHHQEDQAETFLMRLARGSGLEGLGAMRELDYFNCRTTQERPHALEVGIRRPLLDVPKARLVATLKAYGATWVEDPSNIDERFERVRVRRMMPVLAELGLSAQKLALSARRLRNAELDLHWMMDSEEFIERRPAFWHGGLMSEFEFDTGNPFFSGDYVSMRTIRQLLRGHGGGARDAELSQLEKLLILCGEDGRPSGVTLGGCKIEFMEGAGQRMRVYREGSGEGLPAVRINPGQTIDWDGRRFEVTAGENAPLGATVCALCMQGWADLKKAVPRLAELKWPAAAAATLPVVAGEAGIIAYPGITSVLEQLGKAAELADCVPPTLDSVGQEWRAWAGKSNAWYSAFFNSSAW